MLVPQAMSHGGNIITTGGSGGNISGANYITANVFSATGNVTGNYFVGNGAALSNVTGANVSGTVANATYAISAGTATSATTAGTVTTNAQPNITSVGTLTSVAVTGNATAGNLTTAGLITATGNVLGGNLLTGGLVSATGTAIAGNVTTAGLISAGSNITGANIVTAGAITATGNVSTAGIVNTANIYGSAGETISTGGNANINLYPGGTGNIVLPSGNATYINNLASPVSNSDAATKQYVDNLVTTAISYHQGVTAATTANLATTTGGTVTYTQPNGAGNGIGATLTTTGAFNLIDTANVQTLGTRILVKNEGNAVFNGVYTWANATNIVRSTDTDEYGPASPDTLSINDYFFVASGNVNAGSAWIVDAPSGTITFGTSNITFAQFSSSQTYSAGNGISFAGTVVSARVDSVTTAFDAGGNITVKASANLTTPNIGAATGTSVSVTANVTGGNIVTAGLISATGNATAGNIATAGLITATGNATAGNIRTAGVVSATGNVTGNYFIGNGSALTGITLSGAMTWTTQANTAPANVAAGSYWYDSYSGVKYQYTNDGTGNVWVDQSFPTSFTTLAVTGNATIGGNLGVTGTLTYGNISTTGNVDGGNLRTSGVVTATGNITGGNILTAGLMSSTGNAIHGNILTAGLISATGNATAGNILTAGLISATGAITGASATVGIGNITAGNLLISGAIIDSAQLDIQTTASNANIVLTPNGTGNVNTGANVSITGNVQAGNVRTVGLISATGNVTGGNVITAGLISATGNINGGNLSVSTGTVTLGNIVNANGNGVGNIGSSSLYFNTIFAKATSAQYADLAEMYCADEAYEPGTVIEFGGVEEVTITTNSHSPAVAGIVSTNPSYLMNATLDCVNAVQVALTGRVPCRVIGTIHKGDRLVASDIAGVATVLDMNKYEPGCIIGKALENYNSNNIGVIEVAVGRT
jgi:hypothetical protein